MHKTLTAPASASAQGVATTLEQFLALVEQVIRQATRRVLQGEQVPASEKSVSLFEPDMAIIGKGKPGRATLTGSRRCINWEPQDLHQRRPTQPRAFCKAI